jgi:tetratricopeptide (TPR) repeat protein
VLALHALETYAWDAAIEQASALADAYPDVGLLHFIQAQAYDALDQNEQAERAFERALDLAPQNVDYRVAYARHAIKRAEQTALNVNGGALDDIRTRARRYLSAAQRYAQEAIERDPLDPQAFETGINAYLRGGKVEIAQAQLAQARTRGLDSDALRRAATRIKYAESPFSPAHVAELAAQAEAHPDDGRTWLTYGTALLARSRFDEADPVTARALALRPENADAMLLRARVTASNHDYPTATELLDALTQRFPNRPSLIWTAAAIYGNDFQFERSRALLRRLYELADSEAIRQFAIDQLADTHLQVGEAAEALQLLDRYEAEVADNLGLTEKRLIALVRAGRAAEAIQAAEALVDERPQAFDRRLILLDVLS